MSPFFAALIATAWMGAVILFFTRLGQRAHG